jgi:hypothetical protein
MINFRRFCSNAEEILNNITKKEEGNLVSQHPINKIIDIINFPDHKENVNVILDYFNLDINLIQHLLPPKLNETVLPDFSAKEASDIDLPLQ